MFVYVYICKGVKLAIINEADPIATFLNSYYTKVKERVLLFSVICYLDPYLVMLSPKQVGMKYHSVSHWYDMTKD